jgi:GxxExxY protein
MYEHDPLTEQIIGCAIEVHRHLGPGLDEATYEEALCLELTEAEIPHRRQVGVPVLYKGRLIGEHRPLSSVCRCLGVPSP